MPYECGDIVLIPFPFSDLTTTKKRPVLIPTPQDRHGDVVMLAITSQASQDHIIPIRNQDLADGHLPKQSFIRTDKLFTLSGALIIRKVASLDKAAYESVIQQTCQCLGLDV